MPTLSPDELARYSRHLTLPEVGEIGQGRLKNAAVLVVGAGGLGSPSLLYLTAAGVGRIGIVDADSVDVSNLQRQVLHGTATIGVEKTESAAARLADLNPHVQIETFHTRLSAANALDILRTYDVVIDGSDNFPTRYLVNDAAVFLGKPNVYGSVFRFEGQASVFDAINGPCYRCLYPEPPPPGFVPSCEQGGVLGVVPGIIGMIQSTEAIKILMGIGSVLVGRLLLYDALRMRFREMRVPKREQCPVCGVAPTIRELIDYEEFCGVSEMKSGSDEITPSQLAAERERYRLIDVREPYEWEIARIEGAELVPMGQIPGKINDLSREEAIVVYCRSGARSGRVVDYLRGLGFTKVRNLAGGINRWASEVDPKMTKY
jgi:adenylyltransferase/sulfurtransferase